MHEYLKYIWLLIFFTSSAVVGLLFVEYRFFHKQALILMELQENYRNYILTAKQSTEDDKDKPSCDIESFTELGEKKKPFVTVNRDPNYLRDSLIKFLQEKNLEHKLNDIDSQGSILTNTQKKRKPRLQSINRITSRIKNFNGTKRFLWPIKNGSFWLSSFFGKRKKKDGSFGFHAGIDMASVKGLAVVAADSGKVIEASYTPGYGNMVLIDHEGSCFKTRYAHLNSILVKKSDKVKKGLKIGTVGDTGFVRSAGKDASHLHFEVYAFDKPINPLYVLPW